MNKTQDGYLVGQSGVIATCPICLGDMCGCYDDLEVKQYRICKGCASEYKAHWGRLPSKGTINKAIKVLIAKGLWDRKTHSVPKAA
jgi:hypothetical protein